MASLQTPTEKSSSITNKKESPFFRRKLLLILLLHSLREMLHYELVELAVQITDVGTKAFLLVSFQSWLLALSTSRSMRFLQYHRVNYKHTIQKRKSIF